MKTSVSRVHWKHCWRIIPTRYPSENLFERVADTTDLPHIQAIDDLTSTRFRVERGELNYLPIKEQAQGPGSQYINASFAYSLFSETRFSNGSYGVFYGAKTIDTAIAETVFHREEFMRHTNEGPMMLPMRVLDSCLEGDLHDIRGHKRQLADIYSLKTYKRSQAFAHQLWHDSSKGIVYDSVRDKDGECVAVFKPSLLRHCRDERQLIYEWNGQKISTVYELQEFLKIK